MASLAVKALLKRIETVAARARPEKWIVMPAIAFGEDLDLCAERWKRAHPEFADYNGVVRVIHSGVPRPGDGKDLNLPDPEAAPRKASGRPFPR